MPLPTTSQLEDAAKLSAEIDRLQTRLAIILSGGNVNSLPPKKVRAAVPKPAVLRVVPDRPLSASATARPMKKNLSVESRLRISEAAKKRWAKRKAGGHSTL